jgi:hypothetical protein
VSSDSATTTVNTLTKFDDPLFNFDLAFDLVVGFEDLAVLSLTAFDRLFC